MVQLYLTIGLILAVIDQLVTVIEMAISSEVREMVWNHPYLACTMSWNAILFWPVKIVMAVIIILNGGLEAYGNFYMSAFE